jgi:diguanylate cyclase (GGDEF)-like protein/PAS domain S-box-containing protein
VTEPAPQSPDRPPSTIDAIGGFGGLFDALNLGIAIYRAVDNGEDFVFIDINPSGEATSAVQRDAVIGRHLTAVFPGVAEFGLLAILQRVWRTGKAEATPPGEYRDGRVTGWFENHVVRLHNGMIAAVYADVTERVVASRALEASEQRYRMLTESTLDGIYDWHVAGNELFLSPRWKSQLGYDDDELPNALSTWTDRLHPDDRDRVLAHLEEFLASPEPLWAEEFRLQHRAGHFVQFMTRAATVMDDTGKVQRLLGVHIDIDQRKRTETMLAVRVRELACLYTVNQILQQRIPIAESCHRIVAELINGMQFPQDAGARIDLDGAGYVAGRLDDGSTELRSPLIVNGAKRGRIHIGYSDTQPFLLPEEQHLVDSIAKSLGLKIEREEAEADRLMLERVIGTTSDLMSFVDRDYVYRFINDSYARHWRRDTAQIVGRRIGELMGQAQFEELVKPHLDRCLQGEEVNYQASFDYGETTHFMDVRYKPYRAPSGQISGAVVSVRDITQLHRAQEKVRQAARVFSSTAEGVTITDLDGTIIDVNEAFCEITGYTREEAVGQNPRILQSGRHDGRFYRDMWTHLLRDGCWRGEIWNRRKTGESYPEMLTISTVRDDSGQASGFVAVFSDITSVKQTEARLEHLAHHDPLTQLPNRLLFSSRLRQSLAYSARSQAHLAVMFIDIDRFKQINDSLGHNAGDNLLIQIATRLQNIIRIEDTVARISGDEFIVMLENIGSVEHVTVVARKIMDAFQQPFDLEDNELRVTCSIGISLYPEDGRESSILMRNADAAMYRAKADGRNNYQFYTREMTSAAFEQVFLENAMRNALEHGEFRLVYQPQVSLLDRRVTGIEALLRWHHPEQGVISPGRFIPIAEQSGLIRKIGTWVLDEACRQARQWLDDGLDFGRIAVNVSGSQIQQAGFADHVQETLERRGLAADRLELEVTESFLMQKVDESLLQLDRLNTMGIALAIDDFGTGYSSLAYLKQLPVRKLKIDRSFVGDIPGDSNDMAISEAVIALAHALDLEVIAEGIESDAQADFLVSKGCTLGQGFLYSRPLVAESMALLLTERRCVAPGR